MENRYKEFGEKLKEIRTKKDESITTSAKATGIDRSHLSKLENGHERPSVDVLNNLIRHYSLSRAEAVLLSNLAGFSGEGLIVEELGRKEDVKMEENKIPPTGNNLPAGGVQINMNGNIPILYTDSVFVTTNQYGLVFDFAQSMGPTNQQNIVARMGMSKEHARALLRVLQDKLEEAPVKVSLKN